MLFASIGSRGSKIVLAPCETFLIGRTFWSVFSHSHRSVSDSGGVSLRSVCWRAAHAPLAYAASPVDHSVDVSAPGTARGCDTTWAGVSPRTQCIMFTRLANKFACALSHTFPQGTRNNAWLGGGFLFRKTAGRGAGLSGVTHTIQSLTFVKICGAVCFHSWDCSYRRHYFRVCFSS